MEKVIPSAPTKMSFFKPTTDEREALKKAVSKFAHDPTKSQLLSRLEAESSEYNSGSEEWSHLKYCIEKHHLHLQTEMRRDPTKKSLKIQMGIVGALERRFNPNFS